MVFRDIGNRFIMECGGSRATAVYVFSRKIAKPLTQ